MICGTPGCIGKTRHIIHQPGETGFLGKKTKASGAFLPDKDRNLIEGDTELPPGTLFRIPKDEKEFIETLNKLGIKHGTVEIKSLE